MMSDVGIEALQAIHRKLMLDEPWTVWGERSFWWIAHRLAAHVDASPVFMSMDIPISRVTSSIEVVEDVGVPEAEVLAVLQMLNIVAIDSVYVYSPLERAVSVMCAHNAHRETIKWRPVELASAHITGLTLAERFADKLAERLKGRVARRTHPQYGERLTADDMLNVIDEHYVPAGAQSSRFGSATEMQAVHDMVRNTFDFSAGGSADGIAIEVAFGEDETTLVELKADELHPVVGSGLGVFMTVRLDPGFAECCRIANALNRRQFVPGEVVAALGAWTVRTIGEHHYLARTRFVPNANYMRARVVDCAQSAIAQAVWIDSILHPDLRRRSALPAIGRRMGLGEPL